MLSGGLSKPSLPPQAASFLLGGLGAQVDGHSADKGEELRRIDMNLLLALRAPLSERFSGKPPGSPQHDDRCFAGTRPAAA